MFVEPDLSATNWPSYNSTSDHHFSLAGMCLSRFIGVQCDICDLSLWHVRLLKIPTRLITARQFIPRTKARRNLENTTRWPNIGSMLVHRLRRWTNIEPALGQLLVFPPSLTLSPFLPFGVVSIGRSRDWPGIIVHAGQPASALDTSCRTRFLAGTRRRPSAAKSIRQAQRGRRFESAPCVRQFKWRCPPLPF